MRNARYADDPGPLDPACSCLACTGHSRAYLHHLFRTQEMLGPILLTWHNIAYYQCLMRGIREAIQAGEFVAYANSKRAAWQAGLP
jgi:queuine tRNA-ribosyltransferase